MRLTLLLVSELYTFKTGSSTRFVGLTHSGMADEDALGASAAADMVNGLQAMRDRAVACGLRAGDGKLWGMWRKERDSDDSDLAFTLAKRIQQ